MHTEVSMKFLTLRPGGCVGTRLPYPPLRGTRDITPILTVPALVEEGRDQNNCVAAYAERVRRRTTFIYQVLQTMRIRHSEKAPPVVSVCGSISAMTSLDRFKTAQDESASGFESALAEMRAGRKTSHWIWYIFPQLQGLGQSSMAQHYGIHGLREACEYLSDPVLGERLITITGVVEEKLSCDTQFHTLMGGSLDSQKLISSITLFHHAAGKLDPDGSAPRLADFAQLCESILAAAEAQGFDRCVLTQSRLQYGRA